MAIQTEVHNNLEYRSQCPYDMMGDFSHPSIKSENKRLKTTNRMNLFILSDYELAAFLVSKETMNEGDESVDGEMDDLLIDIYVSPSGARYIDESDAIKDAVKWLNAEYSSSNN